MKSFHLGLIFTVLALGGCATPYANIDQNTVTFRLENRDAKRIILACSLDGYQIRPLKQHNGQWEVSLPADKTFSYFYIVDNTLFLPPCPLMEYDDFGSKNCIFAPRL